MTTIKGYFLNTGMLTLFPCFSASFFLNKMPVNPTDYLGVRFRANVRIIHLFL
jgi:hypothetical protein